MTETADQSVLSPRDLLDPQMAVAMDKMGEISTALGAMPQNPDFAQQRARMLAEKAYWNDDPVSVASCMDITVRGPFREIPVRIYRPGHIVPLHAIIHFHGGGWVKGSPESHDRIGRVLANESGAVVFSIDYALSPERKFPEPLDECVAAVCAISEAAKSLGIKGSRLVLAGDSAGGNLALATALDLRESYPGLIAGLLLFYGVFDCDFDTASYHAFGGGEFGLSRDDMMAYWRTYIADGADGSDPRASVLRADLRGLPPTHLCAAGLDVLRDETLDMNERMQAAGVVTDLKRYKGVCHGFLGLGRGVDAGDDAIANAAAFARTCFAS